METQEPYFFLRFVLRIVSINLDKITAICTQIFFLQFAGYVSGCLCPVLYVYIFQYKKTRTGTYFASKPDCLFLFWMERMGKINVFECTKKYMPDRMRYIQIFSYYYSKVV